MSYPVPYSWVVSGTLLKDGELFTQGKVQVFNRLADGTLDWMAETGVSADGSYSLNFSSSAFQKGDTTIEYPNIVIHLYDYQNNLLWESDTYAATETPFELGTIDVSASTDDTWQVEGCVFYNTSLPLSSGNVFVYDIWNGLPTLLAQTTLNTKGFFSCSYLKKAFQKQGITRNAPNLQIVVRDLQGQSLVTYDVPNPVSVHQVVQIQIHSVPGILTNDNCKVYGNVKNTLGYPLQEKISVIAFCLYYKENLNESGKKTGTFEKIQLGNSVTPNVFGNYEITYNASVIPNGLKLDSEIAKGKDKASIFAEVHYNSSGTTENNSTQRSFYSTPLIFNGQSVQEINFILDLESSSHIKSEFEILNELLNIYYKTIITNTTTTKSNEQDKIAEFLESVTQLPLVIGRESLEESVVRAYFKAFQLAHEITITVNEILGNFKKDFQNQLEQNEINQENFNLYSSNEYIVYLCAQYLYPLITDCDVVDISTLLSLGIRESVKAINSAIAKNQISSSLSSLEFQEKIWKSLQKSDAVAQSQEDTFSAYCVFYLLLTKELDLSVATKKPALTNLNSVKKTHTSLLEKYTESGSNYRDLIASLKIEPGILTSSEISDLELLIDLCEFCNWYSDLVVSAFVIAKSVVDSPILSLKDILYHNKTGFWDGVIGATTARYKQWNDKAPLALPLDLFPGTTMDEQQKIAVRTLQERLEAKFPQQQLESVLQNEFSEENEFEKPWHDLILKLQTEKWKDFDLNSSDLEVFLASSPEVVVDETEKEKIRILQRLFRLTNNPQTVCYLIRNDFDSAAKIALVDEERFVAEHGLGMGDKELATNIHRLAKNFVANATLDIERYHGSLNESDATIMSLPRGLNSSLEKTVNSVNNVAKRRLQNKSYANWKTLFGKINRNSGTQNQSILSASAYLLDLLDFLKQGHAYGKFIKRRPDIKDLLMTKSNAEVSLPTIDLAIELLESLVYKSSIQEKVIPLCNQTPDDAIVENLRANPCQWDSSSSLSGEVIENSVRNILAEKYFPMNLPKDIEVERVSAILGNLSLNFVSLSKKLHYEENKALSLNEKQEKIFDWSSAEKWELWGLEENGNENVFFPDKSKRIESTTYWYDVLCNLAFVLDRAKLTYDEFAEIFTSAVFENSGATLNVDSESYQLADVNGYRIIFENDDETKKIDFFFKLSVFVRRRIALGWSIAEVADTWNCSNADLVEIQELKIQLGVTAWEAAVLLDKINLSKNDLKKIYPIDSLFEIYSEEPLNSIDNSKGKYNKFYYELAAAANVCLGIDLEDALMLVQKFLPSSNAQTEISVFESGLEILYKYNLWITANKLSVEDYLFLDRIKFPVAFGCRANCNETIDNLVLLRSSSLSISDLKSILEPQLIPLDESLSFVVELNANVRNSLDECAVQEKQSVIDSENNTQTFNSTNELDFDYKSAIHGLLITLGIENANEILEAWEKGFEPDEEGKWETCLKDLLRFVPTPSSSWKEVLAEDKNGAVFYNVLRDELSFERTLTLVAEQFSVTSDVIADLFEKIKDDTFDDLTEWKNFAIREDLTSENDLNKNDVDSIESLCNRIVRCSALYQFTQSLDLGFEWDWKNLIPPEEKSISYDLFKDVVYAFAASSQILGEVYNYSDLENLDASNEKIKISNEAFDAILTASEIDFERDANSFAITSLETATPAAWCKFADLLYLYKKTNSLPEDLSELLNADNTTYSDYVKKFENNLKQTKTNSEWNKFIQGVNDKLRQLKRDALAAVVCNESQMPETALYYPTVFVDENDIYSYYLMDVKMEPDMAISRTVQAVSCIQLYVQRALMGLEGGYTLNDTQKEQWEWMKNYQVWVANRKIFLYPENWIDGDLREDKTPFFKELEERLAEIGNNQEALTEALGEYLKKVCDASEIDIVGACKEEGGVHAGTLYTLHIIGCTRGEPHTYYYRTYEATALYGGNWTPWEELPLEIDGASIQPAILGGHLYITWLQVIQGQRQKKTGESEGKQAAVTVEYYAEIRLKWASYTGTKWTGVKVGKQAVYDISENQLNFVLGENENLADRYFIIDVSDNSDTLSLELWRTFPDFIETTHVVSVPIATSTQNSNGVESLSQAEASTYLLKTEVSREYKTDQRINYIGNFSLTQDESDTATNQVEPDTGNPIAFTYGEFVKNHSPLGCRLVGNMFYNEGGSLTMLDGTKIFRNTRGPFKLLSVNMGFICHKERPFFYMDSKGCYLIYTVSGDGGAGANSVPNYRVEMISNPQVGEFRRRFLKGGSKWLYSRETEALPVSDSYYYSYSYYNYYFSVYLGYYTAGDWQAWDLSQTLFEHSYLPSAVVAEPYPSSTVDFCWGSATSIYNWELFFFVPMLLADKMLAEQNYEAALNWLQLVFDPRIDLSNYERTKRFVRDLPKGAKYWKFLPFFANQDADKSILSDLSFPTPHDALPDRQAILLLQDCWKNDPFDPQMIARYRPVAYQKYVVMKYLDALIGWGDQLFTQDTTESVNLAVQMYVLAAEILGPKSAEVPDPEHKSKFKVLDLLNYSNEVMNNAFITYEDTMLTGKNREKETPQRLLPGSTLQLAHTTGMMFYFNVPRNETLMGYWDTVADRLYKIRNSLNIEGVKRTLALFAPPIDPALLVKAKANGVSISEVLADASSTLPYYRFKVMVAKAIEIVRDVQQVGKSLLEAIEKQDAETLAQLRAVHEKTAFTMQKTVFDIEGTELEKEYESIQVEQENLEQEKSEQEEFYKPIKLDELYEKAMEGVKKVQETVENVKKAASVAYKIPDIGIGAIANGLGGPSFESVAQGGTKIAESLVNKAESYVSRFAQRQISAAKTKLKAEAERTLQNWTMKKTEKSNQGKVLEKKKIAAEIKIDYIKKQTENLEREIEHKDEIYNHLCEKYSNKELYGWLKKETGTIYKTLFQLAVKVARKAEKCYHFEIGDTEENPKTAKTFIKGSGSYWNGLHSGLLAGEKLLADLHAMEVAYLENDRNELEITRPVSLWELEYRQGDDDLNKPQRPLTDLRDGKDCNFIIPESLFSKDFPDQYFRRIRDVRVEIIAPDYRGHYLNAQLSLTENWLDLKGNEGNIGNRIGTQTMATSTAHQESGKFDFRFGSDKFLPFEGAGAVDSKWSLEITGFDNTRDNEEGTSHSLDLSKIEDVIIHLSYTARMGKTQQGDN